MAPNDNTIGQASMYISHQDQSFQLPLAFILGLEFQRLYQRQYTLRQWSYQI